MSTSALLGDQPTLTIVLFLAQCPRLSTLRTEHCHAGTPTPTPRSTEGRLPYLQLSENPLTSSFTLIFLVWVSTMLRIETHYNFPEMAGPFFLPITVLFPKHSTASTLLNVTSHIKVNLEC